MKLILSRKGFDATNGSCPSPIFPDGKLLSLPIPVREAPMRYSDINYDGEPISEIVTQLSRGMIRPDFPTHLDPDLNKDLLNRKEKWKPAFGQSSAALSHLKSHGVGIGDLFLFFGWFRKVVNKAGIWAYDKTSPQQHVIFGWLQVGEVLDVGSNFEAFLDSHPWLHNHPHLHGERSSSNTIYVAATKTTIPDINVNFPGGGAFKKIHRDSILTAQHQANRSLWALPEFFSPNGRTPLSYHGDLSRWTRSETGQLLLQSVAKGQEFVLDTKDYPEARPWASELISKCTA